ncbi:MAG: hypothetical protein JJT93_10575 [Gammaproteobacteria bacterium]|nr:hypothetical protein [Gammaproteobacteria bacterium]
MSERKRPSDAPRSPNPPPDDASAAISSVSDSDAGKVTFRHGAAVWEWNTRTGAFDLEETTMLLRRLENPALSLDEPLAERDLVVSGEVDLQQQVQSSDRASKVQDGAQGHGGEPAVTQMPAPEDWALQTLSLDGPVAEGGNPYDSLSTGSRKRDRLPHGEPDAWSWALRSGPSKARSDRHETADRRERGYNPYGDDPPPGRRRR